MFYQIIRDNQILFPKKEKRSLQTPIQNQEFKP